MDSTLDGLRALDVPPAALAALVALTLAVVLVDPVVGRRDHRTLVRRIATDPARAEAARLDLYRRWIVLSWVWAAAAATLVTLLPGVGPADLGLRRPDGARVADWARDTGASLIGGEGMWTVLGVLVGVAVGAGVFGALARRAERRLAPDDPQVLAAPAVAPLLPTTPRGRRAWTAVSITAGITEEITYRGLLVLTLALAAPGAPAWLVVVLAAVLFGVAHLYQGPAGVLATGVVGAVLAAIYLATGSVLVPIVLHVLIDVAALAQVPRDATEPAADDVLDPRR